MADLASFTDANFQTEVLDSDIPVVVDVFATWCGPCKMIAPIIEELANDYAGRIKVGKLDADTEQKTAAEFQVRGLPTVLIFKDGKVADSVVGAAAKAQYVEKLEAVL
ncbi:MAG: thioredoxin [Candidatus Latescibacterota bacterium]|jgi:thioredoxin 1